MKILQRYLFFNAQEIEPGVYDREYQANDFADYFGAVLSTGLSHTDEIPTLIVTVESGTMNTVVSAGAAMMKGHLYENTTPLTLTHSIPEVSLNRIDRVVLRLDLRNAHRNILLHVKEGESAENPEPPELQRDQFIHEISLAHIFIRKNTVQLLGQDLRDERLDEELCGIAHSLISIPTDQLQEWINARIEFLDTEMTEQLDQYLARLQVAKDQLEQDLLDWAAVWENWFQTKQIEHNDLIDQFEQSLLDWQAEWDEWMESVRNENYASQDQLNEVSDQLDDHVNAEMPHQYVDNGVTYRWGFRTLNGQPQFIREEVVE